jgi:acyl CoA:acetate/3-ketoacid CoA transferase
LVQGVGRRPPSVRGDTERESKAVDVRRWGAVVPVADAVEKVSDGDVVAISGFNMATTPEYLILELLTRYQRTGHPKGLFLECDASPAIPGRALDLVAQRLCEAKDFGLFRGISIPYLGFSPWLQKMTEDNVIEVYSWPLGVSANWFREVATGRPGVMSRIGVKTAVDPREDGGKMNRLAGERGTCDIRGIVIDGEEYLLYEAPKPTVALIRATTADPVGNLTMEDEVITGTVLSIAQAAKASPNAGTVICQVRHLSKERSWPRTVQVPAPCVDYVVVSPNAFHWQLGTTVYDPAFSYSARVAPKLPELDPLEPDRLVMARRLLLEFVDTVKSKGAQIAVNLGIGIPALASRIALEEGVADFVVGVLESGQWGGVALTGVDFGAAMGPFALSSLPDTFTNFEGGSIDAASLGFMQVGRNGDVNPSTLPGSVLGPGGFPVIAGGSPRIYFVGSFTAGKRKIEFQGGMLRILQEGKITKFVDRVYKNYFSGSQGLKAKKEILYITERAVFRLTSRGLRLDEVAPGVNLDRDVLSKMEFTPIVSSNLRQMDSRLFGPNAMGLAKELQLRGDVRRT